MIKLMMMISKVSKKNYLLLPLSYGHIWNWIPKAWPVGKLLHFELWLILVAKDRSGRSFCEVAILWTLAVTYTYFVRYYPIRYSATLFSLHWSHHQAAYTNWRDNKQLNNCNIGVYKYTQILTAVYWCILKLQFLNIYLFNLCMQPDDGFNASRNMKVNTWYSNSIKYIFVFGGCLLVYYCYYNRTRWITSKSYGKSIMILTSNSSVGNGPSPTLVVYAFTTPITSPMLHGGNPKPVQTPPMLQLDEVT